MLRERFLIAKRTLEMFFPPFIPHMSNGAMYSTNHLLVWQSNSSSPGIIPGQFHPSLLSEYPRPPELHRQSRDYPGMTTQPLGPLCQSIPEHRSYTGSPRIVPGWLPNPWDLSARVSQNAGVTPAVPGLSRDGYPTPWGPLWQSISERWSYTGSPGIVPG